MANLLRLKRTERRQLVAMTQRGTGMARDLRRARVLLLLDEGWRNEAIPAATGASISTVGRVKRHYLEEGLDAAICDGARPGPQRRVTKNHEAQIVAMACSAPPAGRGRWTVRLLTSEAISRGIIETIGRQRVDELLHEHELKPWRKKNVVRT